MKLKIDRRFKQNMSKVVEKYNFQVGILTDKPHNEPQSASLLQSQPIKQYAGGPTRKQSRVKSEKSTGQIFLDNQRRINTNLLTEPFEDKSSDINKFMKSFFDLVAKRNMNIKRLENLMQAIVRNPILKKKYGINTSTTADNKGFNRHLFDTGQMFRAIKAKVKSVRK